MLKDFPNSSDKLFLEVKQAFTKLFLEFAIQNHLICELLETQHS